MVRQQIWGLPANPEFPLPSLSSSLVQSNHQTELAPYQG